MENPEEFWRAAAWLFVLFLIPLAVTAIYLLLGMDIKRRRIFRAEELEGDLNKSLEAQKRGIQERGVGDFGEFKDLVLYNMEASQALLFADNDIDIFADGKQKFDALLRDLEQAKHFIHLQYYIIRSDVLFVRIVDVLKRKAAAGVKVRVLFDGMGSRRVRRNFWKTLREAGIETAEFFPAFWGRLQLRANYRNHRKIVVIDNRIAYLGGFNIGKEYVGLEDKFGYWRDTHLRIMGSGAVGLQLRFLMDWNYAAKENLFLDKEMYAEPVSGTRDFCKLQIVSSGPDGLPGQIRDNYRYLFKKAARKIYIQTPYFIPDEAVMKVLLDAVKSGVEVNLMIPCKPDHPFVYWATYFYMGQLVRARANCYTYDRGFLHSKCVIADGEVFCCGTANMDIRSFLLNFEVNATVYNREKAQEMERIFIDDLKYCTRITAEAYAARSLKIRLKEQICRLLSPLL